MRKTFPLHVEGKNPDRVLDATKHEIRKYVKRQRRVALPAGVDYWDFDCKFGSSEETAAPVHFAAITSLIDAAASEGAAQFYIEMVARNGYRVPKPVGSANPANPADSADSIDANSQASFEADTGSNKPA